jgi:hypothetical protein
MQFSEANGSWQDIPQWANFLMTFGYWWPQRGSVNRRIALISMPCDSAAAGLVALGAMRKFLEDPDANDISLHLQRIRNEPNRELLHRNHGRMKFRFDGDFNGLPVIIQISQPRNDRRPNNTRITFHPKDVRFQDEPFVEVINGNELSYGTIYRGLVNQGGDILETNLLKTYSGVCLAGRIMGENKTHDIMSGIQFSSGALSVGLDQLLSVHDWSREKISRVSFFNSRTKKRDRETAPPSLVVADGDRAFLTVIDHNLFSQSNIIAIIDRTVERDRLEPISQTMPSKSQWYVREETFPEDLPPAPKGISVAIWKKR